MFDATTGALICRRLHKFMNLDQSEESSSSKLDLALHPHVCVEKVDGCMLSGLYLDGNWILVSKNGPTGKKKRKKKKGSLLSSHTRETY